MTLPYSERKSQLYTADGVQRRFDFPFRSFYDENSGDQGIEVRKQLELDYEVILPSQYEVFNNSDMVGGYVLFNTAPEAGTVIYIAGNTPVTQQLNLANYGRFSAESIETALDVVVAMIQEWISGLSEERRQRILGDANVINVTDQRYSELKSWVMQEFPDIAEETFNNIFREFYQQWQDALNQVNQNKFPASIVFDASGKSQQEINDILNKKTSHVIDFGAIGDGTAHWLSEKYTTIADAQAAFPLATITNLRQTIDYAAINQAIAYTAENGGGELRADGAYHYVFTDEDILSSVVENQGQLLDLKSNVDLISGKSIFENAIPRIVNVDNCYFREGEFRDTLMPVIKKRFGLRIECSKSAGFKGTRHVRFANNTNNTLAFIYSYLEQSGTNWIENGANRQCEDIEFSDMFISGYGQFQQLGGKRFRYRSINYDFYGDYEPDDAVCLKTQRFSDGRGSGEIDDVEITNITAKGLSGIVSFGGAVYKDFPIHNIRINTGHVKNCRYVALIKSGGDTASNPSSNTYGGKIYDVNINNITVDSDKFRAVVGLWASYGGTISDINISNVTGAVQCNETWLGSNGSFVAHIHNYHASEGGEKGNIKDINFNQINLSSKTAEGSLGGLYLLSTVAYDTLNIDNVYFDNITLNGCGNTGNPTLSGNGISAGKVNLVLGSAPSVASASTNRYLSRDTAMSKLIVDMGGQALQRFSQFIWGNYSSGVFTGLKSFKVDIAATNPDGSYDVAWLAPEDMYLCAVDIIKVTGLSASSSNYLTFRLDRNTSSGSYFDIWKNDADSLTALTAKRIFQESTVPNASQRLYYKRGERMRLRLVPTGTVAQQNNISLSFEYLPVTIKNYS